MSKQWFGATHCLRAPYASGMVPAHPSLHPSLLLIHIALCHCSSQFIFINPIFYFRLQ